MSEAEQVAEASATLSFIRAAVGEYRNAPCRSADWLSMQVMDALDGSLTRPTADLGEDGEFVSRLRNLVIMDEVGSDNPLSRDAADRIERLREVLVEARADIDFACTAIMKLHEHRGRGRLEQTLKRIDGVLSRSGG